MSARWIRKPLKTGYYQRRLRLLRVPAGRVEITDIFGFLASRRIGARAWRYLPAGPFEYRYICPRGAA